MKTVTVSRCCEIEMTSASVCLATRSAVRCRVPVSRRGDRRVGHELDVRVDELRDVRVEDDRAVHLRQLVEELGRERQVEPHPAREEERELVRLADDDAARRARPG